MKMTRIVALAIPIAFVLLNFAMPVSAVIIGFFPWEYQLRSIRISATCFIICGF